MIDLTWVMRDVKHALAEDIGSGDVSAGLLAVNLYATAEIITREPMVVCGQAWVSTVFKSLDEQIQIDWLVNEGDYLAESACVCRIHGLARDILTGERTALNFLQTLSATATLTKRYVDQIKHTKTRVLDTRKTLPGLRYAQKYAVCVGGGTNHRHGLYDAYLIKENHIKACGSITSAVYLAKQQGNHLLIEVEVENIVQLKEAFLAQPDRILLDNFTPAMLSQAVALNTPHRCDLEASGGINLLTIASIAEIGVDYISVGELTKSVQAIDLTLLIQDITS